MNLENFSLFNELSLLGSVADLSIDLDLKIYAEEVAKFQNDWVMYNPRKAGYNRFGLSLTSLDGEVSGVPDLDSLREYNGLNNTSYQESDFRKPTRIAKHLTSLKPLLEPFEDCLGRTHIIKLRQGGFFPPHRDSIGKNVTSFRLLSVISGSDAQDYKFILDDKVLQLVPGRVYFVNTMLSHSLFSFCNDFQILVANIILSPASVERAFKMLAIR